MSVFGTFQDAFKYAEDIKLPNKICGVDVPDAQVGDIVKVAEGVVNGDFADLAKKSEEIWKVLAKGGQISGNCWGVVDQACDVLMKIQGEVEPLLPLLKLQPEALNMFSKENFDKAAQVVVDVCDAGKLMDKIMAALEGVKQVFDKIKAVARETIEKVKELIPDVVSKFEQALNFQGAMDKAMELFEKLKKLITDMSSIGDILRPICDDWKEGDALGGLDYVKSKWADIYDAFKRFLPAWDSCQDLYGTCMGMAKKAFDAAKDVLKEFKPMIEKLCENMGLSLEQLDSLLPAVAARPDSSAPWKTQPVGGINPMAEKGVEFLGQQAAAGLFDFLSCCAKRERDPKPGDAKPKRPEPVDAKQECN
jgi:hypothetical protein